MIPLFWPQIYKEEWLAELEKVFSTRWIGQGPLVDEFEAQFAQKFGYPWCLAVNSGSSALELAYHLADIRPGDEVISTVLTCTATNLPLVRRGAKIKFADIDDNLTILYDDVRAKVNRNTKAIVVVTLGGHGIDTRIHSLAARMGIPVIIDAAQSLGVRERYGDYVCYSFQAIKHFTTGDGGMLVVNNYDTYERAKRLRWFGIDREKKAQQGWRCMINHQMAQEIEEAGWKWHMNDIAAAMGLVGLRHTDEILAHRKMLCEHYAKLLPPVQTIYGGSCWLFCILIKERNYLMEFLRSRGIECDLIQLRNDMFKAFGGKRLDLPNMNRLENEYLYLPLNCKTTTKDIEFITETIHQFLRRERIYERCDCGELHFLHQRCEQ